MKIDYDCKRCGSTCAEQVEMRGGVYTSLCMDCRTTWDELCIASLNAHGLVDHDAQWLYLKGRVKAGKKVEYEEWLKWCAKKDELRDKSKKLAHNFLQNYE